MSKLTCHFCDNNEEVRYYEIYDLHMCIKCSKKDSVRPVFKDGPNVGEVIFDHLDRPVCHICGKGYRKLCAHTFNTHKLTAKEYKKKFHLETSKGIICGATRKILQEHNKANYEVVVVENLIVNGKDTRFKLGDKGRTKDKVSLQTYKKLYIQMEKVNEVRKTDKSK